MEELELDLNEITPAGAAVLGACLVGKRALKRLSLRENELEDAGAVEVARSLALNPALEVLDLCANQVRSCCLLVRQCEQARVGSRAASLRM